MGKATYKGPVPPDDRMSSGGPAVFSRPQASATAESQLSEEEADIRAGRRLYIGRAVQNVQFEARAKGVELGAISPQEIFELVESGVIGDWPSVQSLRRMVKAEE